MSYASFYHNMSFRVEIQIFYIKYQVTVLEPEHASFANQYFTN